MAKNAPAPPIDREAEFRALQKEEQAIREARGTTAATAAGDPGAGWLGYGDPYERLINRAAEYLPESVLPKTGNSPGAWTRWAGGMLIPQNSPELALAALTLPLGGFGGSATKIGAKAGGKFLPQVLRRAGIQGAKSGLAASAVAGLTGHDPLSHGALGAGGGALGQVVGDFGEKALQSHTVQRMLDTAGDRLKGFSAGLFKNIPAAGSAKEALSNIITGANAQKLEQDIVNLGARYRVNPRNFDPNVDHDIWIWTNEAMGLHGADADKILKMVVDPVSGVRMRMPQVSGIWEFGSPKARKFLIDKGYIGTNTTGFASTYNTLAKEAKNARLVQQWLTGESDPKKITQDLIDDVTKRYFTPDMRLTAEGLSELGTRFQTMRPALERQLGKPAAEDLEKAIFHDVSHGLPRGVSGEPGSAELSWKPPFVKIKEPGVIAHVPGWDKEAGATLGEKAIQALTPDAAAATAQLPSHLLDRPAPPTPVIERPPPQDEPTFGEPPPADRGRESERPDVPPPPIKPEPPALWFNVPPVSSPSLFGPGPESPDKSMELEVNKAE